MPKPAPILTIDQPTPDDSWKRFVAVLCLILFYVEFVNAGHDLWGQEHPRQVLDSLGDIWLNVARMVWAVSFYLLGRGLWHRQNYLVWLFIPAVLSLTALVGFTCYHASAVDRLVFLGWNNQFHTSEAPLRAYRHFNTDRIPWLVLGIGGLVVCFFHTTRSHVRYRAWTLLCIAWLAGQLFTIPLDVWGIAYALGYYLEQGAGLPESLGVGCYAGILLFMIAGLLMGWRTVRTAALVMAAVTTVWTLESAVVYGKLVMISVQCLLYSTTWTLDEINDWVFWPDYFILNKHCFSTLFVSSAESIGPWLLIAVFAWKVPMRRLPDDGSPYPRQLCGNCHYNLRGLDLDVAAGEERRCPECGEVLVSERQFIS